MDLSSHAGENSSLWKELQLLDEKPIILDGKLVKPSNCFRLSGNPPKVIYNTNCPDELKKKIEEIVSKYHPVEDNVSYFYTIVFNHNEIHYTGRITPEFKKSNDQPSSWHIVLNEVFFGHIHKNNDHWENTEQRPPGLTEKVGALIDAGSFYPRSML